MRLFKRKEPQPPRPIRKRVRDLELTTARLIRAGFAGQYHAAFHGRGLEFSQVREYQPGDDIRTIDWNVTARTGTPHVKQFVEERDLTVLLAIDLSSSMSFGSLDRRKIDLAIELASVLAFAALKNGDRVGLVLYSDRVLRYIPPRRGRIHVEHLVHAAVTTTAGLQGFGAAERQSVTASALLQAGSRETNNTTLRGNLVAASEFIQRVAVKRSVIVVLSDLLDQEPDVPLMRLNIRHDVVALEIRDPREEAFPDRGLVRLIDAESGESVLVDLARNDVKRRAAERQRALAGRFRSRGIDHVILSTGIPYERILLQFFERRVARLR